MLLPGLCVYQLGTVGRGNLRTPLYLPCVLRADEHPNPLVSPRFGPRRITASDALHCTVSCRLFRDIHCSIRQKNIHTFCGSAIRGDKSHTYCTCCIPTPYTHPEMWVAGGYRHTLFLHIPWIRSVFKTLARQQGQRWALKNPIKHRQILIYHVSNIYINKWKHECDHWCLCFFIVFPPRIEQTETSEAATQQ